MDQTTRSERKLAKDIIQVLRDAPSLTEQQKISAINMVGVATDIKSLLRFSDFYTDQLKESSMVTRLMVRCQADEWYENTDRMVAVMAVPSQTSNQPENGDSVQPQRGSQDDRVDPDV